VSEAQEFVSKAGAGEYGRPESLINYQKDTPGQSVGTLPQQRKKSN
jgi:hypothetical protein